MTRLRVFAAPVLERAVRKFETADAGQSRRSAADVSRFLCQGLDLRIEPLISHIFCSSASCRYAAKKR